MSNGGSISHNKRSNFPKMGAYELAHGSHSFHPKSFQPKFSGADPDQDAETFIQLIERKINFAPGDASADAGELTNLTCREKALFFFYSEDKPLSG